MGDARAARRPIAWTLVRGLFVTGTDTGAGKSVLAAALIAAMAASGESVRAHKPAVTGLGEPLGPWPPDHVLLGAAAGMSPERVAPLRYRAAVSPQLAAELEGEWIDPARLIASARSAAREGLLVVEGAGGLLAPLARDFTVCDLAVALGLPVLIAARTGLGTINHSLLTLRAARAAGLRVRSVVLTPWPRRPSGLERSNRETLARMGDVEVDGLPPVDGPGRAQLARAGATLPWRRWLERAIEQPVGDAGAGPARPIAASGTARG